ncbi:MAG: HAD family hydrolase [Planctomycetota bacterium]
MSPASAHPMQAAAFFDVDGTLVQTTIVHYYMYFRRRRMSLIVGMLWHAGFLAKCGYYLILDKINRSTLNVVFYRSYAGLPVRDIKALARDCYRDVIEPRFFEQAAPCVDEHRRAGREVVLVTGSIAFIIDPLASRLGIAHVVAPSLVESNGRFTGELDGPPISDEEKARRVRQFADENHIDLSQSHAYGDSIADLPMLETVGHPHAVNPDKALAAAAHARGWPTHRWSVAQTNTGAA